MNERAVGRLLRAQGYDERSLAPDAPEAERALANAFARYDVPTVALQAPSAPDDWEVITDLLTTEEQTARIPVRFPASLVLIGMHPVVTESGVFEAAAANRVPGPDNVLVSIDIDNKLRVTAQQGPAASGAGAGARDGTFVTLSGIGVLVPRLRMLVLDGTNPEVGFTFRSRHATAGASNLGRNVRISVALFTRPLGY